MKKVGEIYDKDGRVSRIVLKDDSDDNYVIQEVDVDQKVVNTVSLNKEEFGRLHNSMRKIKEY